MGGPRLAGSLRSWREPACSRQRNGPRPASGSLRSSAADRSSELALSRAASPSGSTRPNQARTATAAMSATGRFLAVRRHFFRRSDRMCADFRALAGSCGSREGGGLGRWSQTRSRAWAWAWGTQAGPGTGLHARSPRLTVGASLPALIAAPVAPSSRTAGATFLPGCAEQPDRLASVATRTAVFRGGRAGPASAARAGSCRRRAGVRTTFPTLAQMSDERDGVTTLG